MGEPGGLTSVGSHRVGHDWSDVVVGYKHLNWNNRLLRDLLLIECLENYPR